MRTRPMPLSLALSLALCLSAALAACAQAPEPPRSLGLAGTHWQLVAIESMDDAQGRTVVADPSLYTLSFGADGQVAARLNCNRGRASWNATPSGDGSSGSLRFGPMVSTRAMCPPPSLDERLARDLPHVRSFRFHDARLHLSLLADGGIYILAPVTP